MKFVGIVCALLLLAQQNLLAQTRNADTGRNGELLQASYEYIKASDILRQELDEVRSDADQAENDMIRRGYLELGALDMADAMLYRPSSGINPFTIRITAEMIPFYLEGMDEIPSCVRAARCSRTDAISQAHAKISTKDLSKLITSRARTLMGAANSVMRDYLERAIPSEK